MNKERGSYGAGVSSTFKGEVFGERERDRYKGEERWKGHAQEDEVSFLLVFKTSHSIQREKNRRRRTESKVTKIV